MAKRIVLVMSFLGWIAGGLMNAAQAPVTATASSTQAASQPAVFEVAAIKPTISAPRNGCFMRGQPGGQTFIGRCIPLRLIIKYAYKIVDSQIVGGPDPIDNELYDFDAKADRPVTRAELGTMFQKLLAERFKLQFHRETRTMPAFILSVDKAGSKMTPNTTDYEWEIPMTTMPGNIPKWKGTRCPMSYFSWWVGQQGESPVVDKTGLAGFWDFTIEFVPAGMADRRGPNGELLAAPDGPSLATAIRDQLGLKLTPDKAPVEVYAIDHVEKATAN